MQVPNSRLILVGIANSIDLTERALPRLQATGCRPTLVTFPSYSSLQLECLLQQRLAALPGPVILPQAVRLAAKKACSVIPLLSQDLQELCVQTGGRDSLLA